MADYGEFEEITNDASTGEEPTGEGAPARARLPRDRELIGVIVQRLGGNRMEVSTTDGKTRNCRVPGRFKRSLWLRPRDIVMIEPWPDDDAKGDVIYKYSSSAIIQLRKRGLLNTLPDQF